MDMHDPQYMPAGIWQAEFMGAVSPASTDDTVLKFRLTTPDKSDHKNPQAGMGGRAVNMWLPLRSENPETRAAAMVKRDELLLSVGAVGLNGARGRVLRIRVARAVMRSDPSRYKSAVVECMPLVDKTATPYVK